jgi:hypothetical protein
MYGAIFSEEDMKRQLYDLNRDYRGRQTWRDMYARAGLSAQMQQSALNQSYANTMAQAYTASLGGNAAIAGSNVIQGNKQSLLDQNSLALQQAFDAYSQQHVEGSAAIAQNLANANAQIDTVLGEQAKNTIDYANAHYSYLQRLYDDYLNSENKIFDNELWKNKFIVNETDENGNVINERLKTWDELANYATDENGDIISLYDKDHNLTIAGADFFDQMENFVIGDERSAGAISWGQYLSETNPELLSWAQTQNAYDYTPGLTNAGSFKTMFGMTSTDNAYEFAERLGGLSEGQVDKMFSKFENYSTEYAKKISSTFGGAKYKAKAQFAENASKELLKFTNDLGITDDIKEATGQDMNEFVNSIISNRDSMKSGWDMAADYAGIMSKYIISMAGGGAAAGGIGGAIGGPFAGLTAGIGAVVGAVAGFVYGLFESAQYGQQTTSVNIQKQSNIQQSYKDMVAALTSYANNRRNQLNNKK